jgi:hypothetical protein
MQWKCGVRSLGAKRLESEAGQSPQSNTEVYAFIIDYSKNPTLFSLQQESKVFRETCSGDKFF